MRTCLTVGSLSLVALLVACSGGAPEGDVPGAGEEAPAASAAGGDEAGRINALVASAGFLRTDKKADAEPVQKTEPKSERVPSEDGKTSFQCSYTD